MAVEMHSTTTLEGETYQHLERRPHPWRKQLYVRGRNMTVAHLVLGMRANQQSPEEAAQDADLPLEVIEEALRYYRRHRDIIEHDQDEEKRLLIARGSLLDASVSLLRAGHGPGQFWRPE